jgi:hypothetical protein
MFLPGWDSLESVKILNYSFHIAALVFIALLALSEIMALVYAGRSITLAEIRDIDAALHRKQEIDEADSRHAAEIGSLQTQLSEAEKQLSEAEKKVEEIERKQAYQHLTDEQKQALIRVLSPFRGDKVRIFYVIGDANGKAYADDFASVFAKAGWDYGGGSGVKQGIFEKDPIGIEITLNATQVTAGKIPRAAETLVQTLNALGLAERGFRSPGVPPDTIEIRIGKKPPAQN